MKLNRAETMNCAKPHKQEAQLPQSNQDKERTAELTRIQLRKSINKYLEVPRHIQTFYWFYAFNTFTATIETLALAPYNLVLGILNILKPLIGLQRSKHTSFYSLMIILCFATVTRKWQILDVSFLYHSFRGQSAVKLYGAGLALQISEKLLTMLGVALLSRVNFVLKYNPKSLGRVALEMVICWVYIIVHFFSLYLDFILYIIVLNSQPKNMLMYFFVVNLGKMKAATFKKFQSKNFRKSLIYDAKDRLFKITHSLYFIATTWDRVQTQDVFQVILVLFYCSVIDHLRHFSSLAMAGKHSQVEEIYQQSFRSFEKQSQDRIEQCCEWDFAVIPYALFLLKFLDITVWAMKQHDKFDIILSRVYVGSLIYVYLVAKLLCVWLKGKKDNEKLIAQPQKI